MNASAGNCAVCAVEAQLKCTACKVEFYCGTDHQKQHWKVHKVDCRRPYEIRQSEELGRFVVATRDIPAKSVIFTEQPLVVGPKWCLEEFEKDVPIFPCVGCFRPVRIGDCQCARYVFVLCYIHCSFNAVLLPVALGPVVRRNVLVWKMINCTASNVPFCKAFLVRPTFTITKCCWTIIEVMLCSHCVVFCCNFAIHTNGRN